MKKLVSVLLVAIFICTVIPTYLQAGDSMSILMYSDNAKIWFFHYGEKVTWYVMEVWPKNFILTKFGLPAFKVNESVSVTIAAGPDFSAAGEKLFQSFTVDVVPVIKKGSLFGVFVNEFGINKDGKAIYFFRHDLTSDNFGFRWSGAGTFGEKNKCLQIGPMVRRVVSKKFSVEAWLAHDVYSGELSFEFVFNIKL